MSPSSHKYVSRAYSCCINGPASGCDHIERLPIVCGYGEFAFLLRVVWVWWLNIEGCGGYVGLPTSSVGLEQEEGLDPKGWWDRVGPFPPWPSLWRNEHPSRRPSGGPRSGLREQYYGRGSSFGKGCGREKLTFRTLLRHSKRQLPNKSGFGVRFLVNDGGYGVGKRSFGDLN